MEREHVVVVGPEAVIAEIDRFVIAPGEIEGLRSGSTNQARRRGERVTGPRLDQGRVVAAEQHQQP